MSLFQKFLASNRYKYYAPSHFSWLRGRYNNIVARYIVGTYLKLKCHPTVTGHENVPKHGPFIIASNHISLWDPPLVAFAVNFPVAFMAKKELFNTLIKAEFYRSQGCFWLSRERPDSNTIKTALNVLKAPGGHWALCLFPEGTRSKVDEVLSLKKGVTSFAMKTNSPVLPVGIYKSPEGKFHISIGKLITAVNNSEKLQEELYQALVQLSEPQL